MTDAFEMADEAISPNLPISGFLHPRIRATDFAVKICRLSRHSQSRWPMRAKYVKLGAAFAWV